MWRVRIRKDREHQVHGAALHGHVSGGLRGPPREDHQGKGTMRLSFTGYVGTYQGKGTMRLSSPGYVGTNQGKGTMRLSSPGYEGTYLRKHSNL